MHKLAYYRGLKMGIVLQCCLDPPGALQKLLLTKQMNTYDVNTDKEVTFLLFCVSTKIEKEKREHAKQHGMIRTEITGAEIAEEMEKERRLFQLQMCEVSSFTPGFDIQRSG